MNLEAYLSFIKAHEKLLIVALSALLLFHFYGVGLTAWVEHDKRQSAVSNAQSQTLQVQLATLQTAVAEQNAKIDKAMSQRSAVTVIQKQKDDSLEPGALAQRIQIQLGVGTVKYDTTNTPITGDLVFSNEASHKVARDEEDLNKTKLDLVDVETKLSSCQQVTDEAGKTLIAEKKAHADDVKTLNAEKHVEFRRGFKWGYVSGLGTTLVLKILKIF